MLNDTFYSSLPDLLALVLLSAIAFWAFASFYRLAKGEKEVTSEEKIESAEVLKEEASVTSTELPAVAVSWMERLRKGMSRSRNDIWGKFGTIFHGGSLDDEKLEEIEELLYSSDMGPEMVTQLIDDIGEISKKEVITLDSFKDYLFGFLKSRMVDVQKAQNSELYHFVENTGKTKIIMIVGVNGAGKTTTIGKLATKFKAQGAKVVVGACDTFRAAAVDQLEVWCQRANVEMVRAKEGTNPSGVAYEALQRALNENADYCILDTAGRLHNKGNLMDELGKMKRVLQKLDESAPDEILLVIDAVTGQNALRQAEEFNKILGLTGLIFTKCDGSSKAGGAVGIVEKLQVPMTYIGVGEDVDDLNIFDLDEYLNALLDRES